MISEIIKELREREDKMQGLLSILSLSQQV